MTGCEIVVVLTMLYNSDGSYRAVKAHPVIPRKCKAHVRFVARPPARVLFCPVRPS